jgi:hypothetical protein
MAKQCQSVSATWSLWRKRSLTASHASSQLRTHIAGEKNPVLVLWKRNIKEARAVLELMTVEGLLQYAPAARSCSNRAPGAEALACHSRPTLAQAAAEGGNC